MDATTQIWIVMKQSTNLELNEPLLILNECENSHTHTQQQPQAPNTHKKPTIRLTTRVKVLWAPQKSLLYRLLVLDEVKCKTHTQ